MALSSFYQKCVREFCRRVSPITQRLGFVLSPTHFYFPIPDTRDMQRRHVWKHRTALLGIDWNEQGQKRYLAEIGRYGKECEWPDEIASPITCYSSAAPSFGYSSAMFAYGAVRHFQPSRIIEVGCGWSTLLMIEALARNEEDGAAPAKFTGIDPYPPGSLEVPEERGKLLRRRVQDINPEEFESLHENDILFIDSSHVLNTGSDVEYLYLEILPRLRPGVVVHIHDIQMPFQYPEEYAQKQRWFWNEQYLLQSFLQFNHDFEILAAGHWLCREKQEWLRESFPHYDPATHSPTGSFWMRRRVRNE